jgi:hypothetical protein
VNAGIGALAQSAGGYLALIGSELAVWSEIGAGTEVELRLPARTVYATSARRSWLSRALAWNTAVRP